MKILITGASRGLGYSSALFLTDKGYEVIGCARGNIKENRFKYLPGVDLESVKTFSILDDILPQCDVIINNAAIAEDCLLLLQGESNIEKIIKINLISTLILCKKYIRERLKNKLSGNIINISSLCTQKTINGLAVYAASKAGLEMASKVLAKEMGPKGFKINCISPGYLETDMSKELSISYKNKIINKTPLQRLSAHEDIHNMIEFLISDKSKFITGQNFVVDGGLSC